MRRFFDVIFGSSSTPTFLSPSRWEWFSSSFKPQRPAMKSDCRFPASTSHAGRNFPFYDPLRNALYVLSQMLFHQNTFCFLNYGYFKTPWPTLYMVTRYDTVRTDVVSFQQSFARVLKQIAIVTTSLKAAGVDNRLMKMSYFSNCCKTAILNEPHCLVVSRLGSAKNTP